jgi:hypothetical protein
LHTDEPLNNNTNALERGDFRGSTAPYYSRIASPFLYMLTKSCVNLDLKVYATECSPKYYYPTGGNRPFHWHAQQERSQGKFLGAWEREPSIFPFLSSSNFFFACVYFFFFHTHIFRHLENLFTTGRKHFKGKASCWAPLGVKRHVNRASLVWLHHRRGTERHCFALFFLHLKYEVAFMCLFQDKTTQELQFRKNKMLLSIERFVSSCINKCTRRVWPPGKRSFLTRVKGPCSTCTKLFYELFESHDPQVPCFTTLDDCL